MNHSKLYWTGLSSPEKGGTWRFLFMQYALIAPVGVVDNGPIWERVEADMCTVRLNFSCVPASVTWCMWGSCLSIKYCQAILLQLQDRVYPTCRTCARDRGLKTMQWPMGRGGSWWTVMLYFCPVLPNLATMGHCHTVTSVTSVLLGGLWTMGDGQRVEADVVSRSPPFKPGHCHAA